MINICLCGAEATYPHADDCPYPLYRYGERAARRWRFEQRARRPFRVQVFVDGAQLTDALRFGSLRSALRCAWELAGGIPQTWTGIRRGVVLVADLETNFRGELAEANVYAYADDQERPTLVTPLNPAGPIFAGVFAQ
jgi:hypothetical protein